MQKRALCAGLCLAICLAIGSHATAAESNMSVMVDGAVLEQKIVAQMHNEMAYVSYWPIVMTMFPNATGVWETDHALVQAPGLTLTITPGAEYLVANGRYLYVPGEILVRENSVLVPARVLAQALGATMSWDEKSATVAFQSGSRPIDSGDKFYPKDELHWLSHIIGAESGNQALEGKIAVGNVVMNRVASPRFPNTIYEVIFQKNQFTPTQNGAINRTPSAESVIAAKLVLEGANTAGDSLYFVNPHAAPNSWASRNREYVATIGAHAFFA